MRLLLLLLFTALPVLGFGQELLTVESTQRRDTPFRIEHSEGAKVRAIFAKVDSSGRITWAYLSDSHFIREKTVTYMAAPPGEYLITVGGSQIVKVIEEGRPEPRPKPPPPNPGPEPQPDPQPSPDKMQIDWFVWVEEVSERGKHREAVDVMTDPEVWSAIATRKAERRIYDDDSNGAKSLLPHIKQPLPVLVLLQNEPEKLVVLPAPKTKADFKSILEKYAK